MDENKVETPIDNTGDIKEKEAPKTFDEILKEGNYQAEFDRRVQKAIATAKSKWEPKTIEKEDSKDDTDLKKEIEALKKQIADDKAEKDAMAKDNALTKDITKVFGDKEFINEYTKEAVINEIKSIYNSEDNIKTLDEIFNQVTKDKEDVFKNPNQVKDIPNVSANVFADVDKDAFNKMGYKERLALKEENPELFKKLND